MFSLWGVEKKWHKYIPFWNFICSHSCFSSISNENYNFPPPIQICIDYIIYFALYNVALVCSLFSYPKAKMAVSTDLHQSNSVCYVHCRLYTIQYTYMHLTHFNFQFHFCSIAAQLACGMCSALQPKRDPGEPLLVVPTVPFELQHRRENGYIYSRI